MTASPTAVFDAHLDLAYLAEAGRDMLAPAERADGPDLPAAVTFPALAEGPVRAALGTIFIQQRVVGKADPHANADGRWTYSSPDEAYAAAMRQVERYQQWREAGVIRLATRGSEFEGEAGLPSCPVPLQVMIMMEGAAGVRSPAELETFYGLGVRVLSLTWADGNQYSGGNASGGDITPAGRELVAEMDRLGMVHDVSHLSEAAFWTLMKIARGPKVATHSNCRALLPGAKYPERHLADDQIRALAEAGGMIGVVLFSNFLTGAARATVADVLRHIGHIERIAGRRECIGLGSDADGGFSAARLPVELAHPRQFGGLVSALRGAGWSEQEAAGFAYGNWAAFLRRALS